MFRKSLSLVALLGFLVQITTPAFVASHRLYAQGDFSRESLTESANQMIEEKLRNRGGEDAAGIEDASEDPVPDLGSFGRGSMSVHILGEVKKPGTYSARPTDRLLAALQMSGGVTLRGSEISIELRRGKQKPRIINLMELTRSGDLRFNPYLQENDVIFVPQKKGAISIRGPVKYPGVYEIDPAKKLDLNDALALASGFTVGLAQGEAVTVVRYNKLNQKQIFKIAQDKAEMEKFAIDDGDSVFVPHKFIVKNAFENTVAHLPNDKLDFPSASREVFILGGVRNPGKYTWVPYHPLSRYVALAGGLSRSGKNKVTIYRLDGTRESAGINSQVVVNPGETVMVDEAYLTPEQWISILIPVISLGLTTYVIVRDK